MTARLTIDQVQPGMHVVCVDASDTKGSLVEGRAYTISGTHNSTVLLCEFATFVHFLPHRFIPAPALPAMTPELLARVDRILDRFERCASTLVSPDYATGFREAIVSVREEIGILPPPAPEPPGVTDVQATLQEWWWA